MLLASYEYRLYQRRNPVEMLVIMVDKNCCGWSFHRLVWKMKAQNTYTKCDGRYLFIHFLLYRNIFSLFFFFCFLYSSFALSVMIRKPQSERKTLFVLSKCAMDFLALNYDFSLCDRANNFQRKSIEITEQPPHARLLNCWMKMSAFQIIAKWKEEKSRRA